MRCCSSVILMSCWLNFCIGNFDIWCRQQIILCHDITYYIHLYTCCIYSHTPALFSVSMLLFFNNNFLMDQVHQCAASWRLLISEYRNKRANFSYWIDTLLILKKINRENAISCGRNHLSGLFCDLKPKSCLLSKITKLNNDGILCGTITFPLHIAQQNKVVLSAVILFHTVFNMNHFVWLADGKLISKTGSCLNMYKTGPKTWKWRFSVPTVAFK